MFERGDKQEQNRLEGYLHGRHVLDDIIKGSYEFTYDAIMLMKLDMYCFLVFFKDEFKGYIFTQVGW